MNAVAVPAFGGLSSPSDRLKSDFQSAVRRNLHSWARWRTELNDRLVEAVMTGCRLAEVEPIGACLDREAPHPGHPTSNPKTLLTYSAADCSSTPLATDEFYKYGIPRARIDPQRQRHLAAAGRQPEIIVNSSPTLPLTPSTELAVDALRCRRLVHSATALDDRRRHQQQPEIRHLTDDELDDDDDEDDELVLDYFNFDSAPSPTTNAASRRRRFHRSAATLPTVPCWTDDNNNTANQDDSKAVTTTSVSSAAAKKKSSARRLQVQGREGGGGAGGGGATQHPKTTLPVPSYAEPFSRQRMITARRDDVLYTNNCAWQTD